MTVFLVGAGPGDPGLLTVRAAAVLARAELVVHDRLVDPAIIGLAPASAQRIDVGKRPGAPVAQEEINALLVRFGRLADPVVRLKGGDPFVFGRGSEEAEALAVAGVGYEVVPGVTSAIALASSIGVPVTHRGIATSFTVVTGHSTPEGSGVDWEALARVGGTIVVLMGVAHRARIVRDLIAGGRDRGTPVVAIERGATAAQRVVRTTLGDLATVALEPPATIVIGAVAGLALSPLDTGP